MPSTAGTAERQFTGRPSRRRWVGIHLFGARTARHMKAIRFTTTTWLVPRVGDAVDEGKRDYPANRARLILWIVVGVAVLDLRHNRDIACVPIFTLAVWW